MKSIEGLEAALAASTPGEWEVLDMRTAHKMLAIVNKAGVIARIEYEVSRRPLSEEDAANARLIALMKNHLPALIECVEALEELHGIVQGHLGDGDKLDSFTLQPARAALAKLQEVKS